MINIEKKIYAEFYCNIIFVFTAASTSACQIYPAPVASVFAKHLILRQLSEKRVLISSFSAIFQKTNPGWCSSLETRCSPAGRTAGSGRIWQLISFVIPRILSFVQGKLGIMRKASFQISLCSLHMDLGQNFLLLRNILCKGGLL